MDESLTAFQETKNNCVGPKTVAKKNTRSRKAPKRPHGQKDIRTALQSVKNELESYSQDFDKVCKNAGIDVDSEQLQLAIALSKSLQETASTSKESLLTQTVTTQERIGKIRTTLQEYGFKVPEIKIASNKTRKLRKNYKLIQTSEAEKKEIVANRYAHVLFQDITHCTIYSLDIDPTNILLYYLASNVSYDVLRTSNVFYVDNLIEKSTSTGNLLKDWSKIPGRPESPKLFEPMRMNFSEIECSQEELNIILSGSLKSCKDVVTKKIKGWHNSNKCKLAREDNVTIEHVNKEKINKHQDKSLKVDTEQTKFLKPISVNNYRSTSPDIFDDDEMVIFVGSKSLTTQKENSCLDMHTLKTNTDFEVLDLTEPVFEKSQPKLSLNITNRKSNVMELTECIQIQSKDNIAIVDQSSQKTNVTKRRSNDFMELTECVTSSQPIVNRIDLTQSPNIIEENKSVDDINQVQTSLKPNESNIVLTKGIQNDENTIIKKVNKYKDVESMDLTQSSNTSDELPFVSLIATRNKSLDDSDDFNDTVVIDINDYAAFNGILNSQTNIAHIDLTQNIKKDNKTQGHSLFDEFNHDHSDSLEEPKQNIMNEENEDGSNLKQSIEMQNSNNFITQTPKDSLEENKYKSLSQHDYGNYNCSQIIIEPIPVEDHPSNSSLSNFYQESNKIPNSQYANNLTDDIDLTQKSDTSEELNQSPKKYNDNNMDASNEYPSKDYDLHPLRNSQRCSSVGENNDVSIDYDDFINATNAKENKNFYSKNTLESVVHEKSDENEKHFSRNKSFLSNCSQTSETFEISDEELDYSLHKSKLEMPRDNFALGGISIMDELCNSKKSIEADNSTTANELKIENLLKINREKRKNNEISPIKHRRITEIATPQKAYSSNMITAMTPGNNEIIIKTSNATPMTDFTSMSTPDIHKELDKYGIKPLKRKRAIQLLTHIYNQTHPIIEAADYLASSPKRRKRNDPEPKSPRKLLPRKLLQDEKSSKNYPDIDKRKENNVQNNNEEGNTRKGKGNGKCSLGNRMKDVLEKTDDIESVHKSKEVNETPILKEIECSAEDWVFQKREKAKVHSCRVPLHIAFYNYIASRRDVRDAILCYEPVEIDLIHKDLVGYGHRYHPKDLLKFLDKKCITVKTTDNDARNQKR